MTIVEEVNERLRRLTQAVYSGTILDNPIAVNEMLKAICIKNEIYIPVEGITDNAEKKDFVRFGSGPKVPVIEKVEGVIDVVDSMTSRLIGKTVAVSETIDLDEYKIRITIARTERRDL